VPDLPDSVDIITNQLGFQFIAHLGHKIDKVLEGCRAEITGTLMV
jgi:hypothetical protein